MLLPNKVRLILETWRLSNFDQVILTWISQYNSELCHKLPCQMIMLKRKLSNTHRVNQWFGISVLDRYIYCKSYFSKQSGWVIKYQFPKESNLECFGYNDVMSSSKRHWCFFVVSRNLLLNKQPSCLWFGAKMLWFHQYVPSVSEIWFNRSFRKGGTCICVRSRDSRMFTSTWKSFTICPGSMWITCS